MRPVISIPHSVSSIPLRLFCLYSAVKWKRDASTLAALVPFSLSLFFTLSFSSFARSPCTSPSSDTLLLPSVHPKLDTLTTFHPPLPSLPNSLFRRFFFPSPIPNAWTSPRLALPALSHLLHCYPFPFCSFTNRAAREYIFYRHSWWPPRICTNLPARATSSLPQAGSPLSSRSNTGSVQLTLLCLPLFSYDPMLFRWVIRVIDSFGSYVYHRTIREIAILPDSITDIL